MTFVQQPALNKRLESNLVCAKYFKNIHRQGLSHQMGFPGGASGKEPGCQCRRHQSLGFDP